MQVHNAEIISMLTSQKDLQVSSVTYRYSAGGLGFNAWAGQVGRCNANGSPPLQSSELCWPGA